MTKKSQLRRNSDAALAKQLGRRAPSATKTREAIARAWFQLNITYNESRNYLAKIGGHLLHYVSAPEVIMKIDQMGNLAEFNSNCKEIGTVANALGLKLAELHSRHVNRKGLCKSLEDVNEARLLIEAYDAFKMEVYSVSQPIIAELNRIYNNAVKAIMAGPTDVEFKEVPPTKTFAEVADALEPQAAAMEATLKPNSALEVLGEITGYPGTSAVLQPN